MAAQLPEKRRATAWVKDEPFGVEFAEIDIAEEHLTARGVAIGARPVPYRLDYELKTATGFVTVRLRATTSGEGWRRDLDLRRDADGSWTAGAEAKGHLDLPSGGGDTAGLASALDCDLGLSPVTNMMPILRHGLLDGGGPIDFTMAWVAVPALAVQADGQRYRHIRSAADHRVIRYEAIDGSFAADIIVDLDAVVVDYPAIARRLSDGAPRPEAASADEQSVAEL
jgi:hypothetical protein